MGICNSCESTSLATAKLILQNGQLQEFSKLVKVSHALQMMNVTPMHFICDSDDMEFGGFFSAVDGDEELQLGQLYFVLPLSWLRKPLQPEQMVALAVRASLALSNMRRGQSYGSGCKSASPVVFTIKKDVKTSRMAGRGSGDCGIGGGVRHREVVRRRRRRGGRRYGRGGGSDSFRTRLSVILEDDDDKIEGA